MITKSENRTILSYLIAFIVVIIALTVQFFLLRSAFSSLSSEGLDYLNHSEEHFDIGHNLYQTGKLINENLPNTERPPGYPVFVAGVLHSRDFLINHLSIDQKGNTILGEINTSMVKDDHYAVILANFFLAAISGLLLFGILQPYISNWIALTIVGCYLVNINMLALLNKYDYSLMEVTIIFILIYLFLEYETRKKTWILIILGVSLGISCLIRPVYLLFPGFFFIYDFIFGDKRFIDAFKRSAIILSIAFLTMVPNIIRNYNVAHKFILVSEQGGVELYHNSVISFWQHPEYADYGKVWSTYGWPLIKNKFSLQEYSPKIWYTQTAEVSDTYWNGSVQNLTKQPVVYLTNIAYNVKQIVCYNLDYWGGRYFKQNAKHFAGLQSFRIYLNYFLAIGSIAFILVVLKPKKGKIERALFYFAGLLVLSYSFVFYYPRYNYIKIPILMISLAICLNWIWNSDKYPRILKPSTIFLFVSLLITSLLPLYYFYIYL